MSKSKWNWIDPLEMCDKYWTDALRLALFMWNAPWTDMRLWEEKIENSRNFVNKIWNASRFVQMQIEENRVGNAGLHSLHENWNLDSSASSEWQVIPKNEVDKWILNSLNNLVKWVTKDIEEYNYSQAGQKLYDFTWNEFCDWYLELSKWENQNLEVLIYTIKTLLKLLHPFIPFVTEAIYSELFSCHFEGSEATKDPNKSQWINKFSKITKNLDSSAGSEWQVSVTEMKWPKENNNFIFKESWANVEEIILTIKWIRELRREMWINPANKINAKIKTSEKFIYEAKEDIKRIAKIENLEISNSLKKEKDDLFSVISSEIEVILPSEWNIDEEKEKLRKEKELIQLEWQIKNLKWRLSNKAYTDKAPKHLVDQTKNELEEVQKKLEILKR